MQCAQCLLPFSVLTATCSTSEALHPSNIALNTIPNSPVRWSVWFNFMATKHTLFNYTYSSYVIYNEHTFNLLLQQLKV